jgi:peptide/nickel transport system permease protein
MAAGSATRARVAGGIRPPAPGVKTVRWRAVSVLLRNPTAVAGMVIVLGWVVVALTVNLWAPYDPLQQDVVNRLQPPSLEHLFGTDHLGRDVFSRVLYASQISLPMVIIVAGGSLLVGSLVGAVASFTGGPAEVITMRLADITLAFPAIVLAMAIITAAGPGLSNAMIAMLIVSWPQYARLIRSQVISVKKREHVEAARCIGATGGRVLVNHILPLCVSIMIVTVTLDLGNVLLLGAALSFLGLGAVPPQAEWGYMVAEGRTKFLQWWVGGFPGLAIMSLVLGFNFIGDGLRDALDPRFTRR